MPNSQEKNAKKNIFIGLAKSNCCDSMALNTQQNNPKNRVKLDLKKSFGAD